MRRWQRCPPLLRLVAINSAFFACFFLLFLLALEVVLRSSQSFDQLDHPAPTYIPRPLKNADARIDASGRFDIWGFRSVTGLDQLDRLTRPATRPCRVVVLGDSFVQGDGLPVTNRWPDQLQRLSRCDIIPIGRNGWTSLEQLAFYEGRLRHFDFDLLVIGFVSNDPDPRQGLKTDYLNLPSGSRFDRWALPIGFIPQLQLGLSGLQSDRTFDDPLLQAIRIILEPMGVLVRPLAEVSHAVDFINQKVSAFATALPSWTVVSKDGRLQGIRTWGYMAWMRALYTPTIFSRWRLAFADFDAMRRHRTVVMFSGGSGDAPQLTQARRTLQALNLPVLDCTPATSHLFGDGLRPRRYWANPADAHPGVEQAAAMAQCLNTYLQRELR